MWIPRFLPTEQDVDYAVTQFIMTNTYHIPGGSFPPYDHEVEDARVRYRRESRRAESIYGAYTFLLMHHRTQRECRRANAISKFVDDHILGCAVDVLPEARRVYLALCKRNGITPEATS